MSETNQELTQEYYTRTQTAISELSGRFEDMRKGSYSPDDVASDISKLRRDFANAIPFLPTYDQRRFDKQLKDLEAKAEQLRTSLAPKTKFVFKRKTTNTTAPATASASPPSTDVSLSNTINVRAEVFHSGLSISGHARKYLTLSSLSSPWSSASDLTISDLDHCIVNLVTSDTVPDVVPSVIFNALHARNLTNTLLILPIVAGSALLHDMTNCVIALGSRQFRMHTSSQVDVYISIASNPIIEHSSAICFADYPAFLRRHPADHPVTKSNCLAVQDFSHIRATPSPNWSALSDEAAIPERRWPLSPIDVGLGDVLQHLLPGDAARGA